MIVLTLLAAWRRDIDSVPYIKEINTMSLIVHRCSCGHIDQFHTSIDDDNHEGCSYGACRTPKHEFGESEVIPSWSQSTGEDEGVVEPGSAVKGYPHRTCSCEQCRRLYASLTA